ACHVRTPLPCLTPGARARLCPRSGSAGELREPSADVRRPLQGVPGPIPGAVSHRGHAPRRPPLRRPVAGRQHRWGSAAATVRGGDAPPPRGDPAGGAERRGAGRCGDAADDSALLHLLPEGAAARGAAAAPLHGPHRSGPRPAGEPGLRDARDPGAEPGLAARRHPDHPLGGQDAADPTLEDPDRDHPPADGGADRARGEGAPGAVQGLPHRQGGGRAGCGVAPPVPGLPREGAAPPLRRLVPHWTGALHGQAPLRARRPGGSGRPPEQRGAFVRRVLDHLAKQTPTSQSILPDSRAWLEKATSFVRTKDLVRVPDEPLKVVEMPEYRRGVAVAYCDSSGPLEPKPETLFAISPPPSDWPPARVQSFFREYNESMLADLTIHEAMPGHYLQIMHSNTYPSKLRAVLGSGPFVEGWAVYTEWLMASKGFGGAKVKLQQQKMILRTTA